MVMTSWVIFLILDKKRKWSLPCGSTLVDTGVSGKLLLQGRHLHLHHYQILGILFVRHSEYPMEVL